MVDSTTATDAFAPGEGRAPLGSFYGPRPTVHGRAGHRSWLQLSYTGTRSGMGDLFLVRGLAVYSAAVLVAVAFLDGGSPPTAGTAQGERSPRGGSVVLAAEEWPRCLNPITSCTAGHWAH